MSILEAALLFVAAMGGGAMNSVAGGGSFLTFPSLLFFGVPPIAANATSTVALWPGSLASVGAYRRDLPDSRRYLIALSVASLLGGLAGAVLLLHTPADAFRRLIPWLLLFATLIFTFGARLVSRLRGEGPVREAPTRGSTLLAFVVQFVISTYGGFFGGGMGIVMLATFAISGMRDIHAMNGMKNWMAVCINGIAVLTFVLAGAVYWPQAGVMLGGAILGGYGGASYAKRLNPLYIRRFIIALGFGLSLYFFVKG
jgi:uncharacterized membrane protein YfcA